MNTHKHYELARRAHYGTSFTPDKRAENFCTGFDKTIAKLATLGIDQHKIEKYESLVVAHLQAKSRCMSSMIAGSANFPVRRAEKANNAEHARSLECSAYYEKIVKEAKQEAYYMTHPEARPVMSGDSDAGDNSMNKDDETDYGMADAKAFDQALRDNMPYNQQFYTKNKVMLCNFVSYYESCKKEGKS